MIGHDIYLRRAYAAHRACLAIDRVVRLASLSSSNRDKEKAMRWMKAWIAFAVVRHK
jgi:hypothetical protein